MSDRSLMVALFFISLAMLIYVEYQDDYVEIVQPECDETINMNLEQDECVESSRTGDDY